MSDISQPLDLREQIVRIDRAIAETAKFTSETTKYVAEQRKLEAEARQFDRNRWQIILTAMTAGAALFGAGAAFLKVLT